MSHCSRVVGEELQAHGSWISGTDLDRQVLDRVLHSDVRAVAACETDGRLGITVKPLGTILQPNDHSLLRLPVEMEAAVQFHADRILQVCVRIDNRVTDPVGPVGK